MLFILTTIVSKNIVPCISEIKQIVSLIILTVQKRDRLGERGVKPGGKHSPMARYREAPPERGYLFQALGILKCRDSTC